MPKKYFFLKLIPSRPDFAQTMSEQERNIMYQHIAYWKKFLDKGITLVYGPVLDPKGAYGVGIVGVEDENEVKELIKLDPAAQINKYEYYPMNAVVKEAESK